MQARLTAANVKANDGILRDVYRTRVFHAIMDDTLAYGPFVSKSQCQAEQFQAA